jgi:hypothetical protein
MAVALTKAAAFLYIRKEPRTMANDNYVNEDGELISSVITALQLDLTHLTSERDMLKKAVELAQARQEAESRELVSLRHELHGLRQRLTTVDVPVGNMNIVGRLVLLPSGIAIVCNGRPIKISVPTGWQVAGETGQAVSVTATLGPYGWTLWTMNPLMGAMAEMPVLDPTLVERLITPKPKADPAAKLTDIEDLDKDGAAAAADLRRHSHHVSAISLHIVLARWKRGVGAPMSDAQANALKLDVKDVVENTLGWKLLAVNTGSISARHVHDHVHVACSSVSSVEPIGAAIGRLKAITSKRMRAREPALAALDAFWSAGYYVGGIGGPNH